MESIIEDYQNVDMSSSGGSRFLNNGNNSILKHLSKFSNSKSGSSPSQLRKKRQHHVIMRSTYIKYPSPNQMKPKKHTAVNDCKNEYDSDDIETDLGI